MVVALRRFLVMELIFKLKFKTDAFLRIPGNHFLQLLVGVSYFFAEFNGMHAVFSTLPIRIFIFARFFVGEVPLMSFLAIVVALVSYAGA